MALAAIYGLGVPLSGLVFFGPLYWLKWTWWPFAALGCVLSFAAGWNAAARYWWKHNRVDTL